MADTPQTDADAPLPELHVGQQVIVHSERWTPDGWQPLRQIATVIDPCVTNDPVYAGDVEVSIDGELSHCFYARCNLEIVPEPDQPPFEREERFIVIKRKHLSKAKEEALRTYLHDDNIGTVECVVVESDWPEYETVWKMIEDRVTSRAPVFRPVGDEVEQVAQFLHDEGGFDEAWTQHTWPEHPEDTGQRDDGFVKIVPSDVQAKFRDVARRLMAGRTFAPAIAGPAAPAKRECPSSPDGLHQVDTSMESGPNNCFHCERPMGFLNKAARP